MTLDSLLSELSGLSPRHAKYAVNFNELISLFKYLYVHMQSADLV